MYCPSVCPLVVFETQKSPNEEAPGTHGRTILNCPSVCPRGRLKPRKAQTKKHRGRTDGQFWIVRPCVPYLEKPKQRNTGDTRTDNSELSVGVPSTQKSPNKKTSGTHGRTHGRIADQPMSLQRRCAVHFHRFSSIFEGIFHRFFSVCKGFPKDF